jgi:hypothetical protein
VRLCPASTTVSLAARHTRPRSLLISLTPAQSNVLSLLLDASEDGGARPWPLEHVELPSYFLQEAEGLSQRAKVEWARLRGDVLQHNGVILDPPQEMQCAELEASLSAVCEPALGYCGGEQSLATSFVTPSQGRLD